MNEDRVPKLIRVDETDRHGLTPRELQRRAGRGELLRIRAGVYVFAHVWAEADRIGRDLARIAAVVSTRRTQPVLFGPSAALVLGLPLLDADTREVHLLSGTRSAPPNGNGVVWHRDAVPSESIMDIGGLVVTDVHRTVLDLARRLPFVRAIPALDRGVSERFEGCAVRYGSTGESSGGDRAAGHLARSAAR